MSHASEQVALPEVPTVISDRYVTYHDDIDIGEYLRALEHLRPGLFTTMIRMIEVLESDPGIEATSVDYAEEDVLKPVTIWAESTFPMKEREEQLLRFHGVAKDTLNGFADLVLVAVT